MQRHIPFGAKHAVYFPGQLGLSGKLHDNRIEQLHRDEVSFETQVDRCTAGGISGSIVVEPDGSATLVSATRPVSPVGYDRVIWIPSGLPFDDQAMYESHDRRAKWLYPSATNVRNQSHSERIAMCTDVRNSWTDAFDFREALESSSERGLRPPQIGAIHAAIGHWRSSDDHATIVMPTGTGKTETMLALLVAERIERLLVVVPTDALRMQTSGKFLSLGLLRKLQTIGAGVRFPVVGTMRHSFQSRGEAVEYFESCNVVIATMNVLNACSLEARKAIVQSVSHLFIDEAHHVTAPTWHTFRRSFDDKAILQFTATPYRRDGKLVDGRPIFNYPLSRAQAAGYYRKFNFIQIHGSRKRADREIAEAAVSQIIKDDSKGYKHIIMARTNTIERAEAVHQIYEELAPHYNPLIVHSQMPPSAQRKARRELDAATSRVLVCVDMFGEGFDYPALKVAAMHDIHKSLAITLQFTGRFARARPGLGDATVIARFPDGEMDEALNLLYRHDAEWDLLLPSLNAAAANQQINRNLFFEGFDDVPSDVNLSYVRPKMSTVVYQAKRSSWDLGALASIIPPESLYAGPTSHKDHSIAFLVTREAEPVPWLVRPGSRNVNWHIYIYYLDEDNRLLYVHSSNMGSHFVDHARALMGDDVEMIAGDMVYRTMAKMKRIVLSSLGLNHAIARSIRHIGYMGANVEDGITEAGQYNRSKAYLFGVGYEEGKRVDYGCSYKGRIWSRREAADISQWTEWCDQVGAKLLDQSLSFDSVLSNTLESVPAYDCPSAMPILVDWPEAVLKANEEDFRVVFDDTEISLYDVGIEIVEPRVGGPIKFRVFTDEIDALYEVQFTSRGVIYTPIGPVNASIRRTPRSQKIPLSEWFDKEHPVIRFHDSSYLEHNQWYRLRTDDRVPFDPARIQVWEWSGVNIKVESQTPAKFPHSIQRHVLDRISEPDYVPQYDIIINDDDSREIADIVAFKKEGDRLLVHLYHCKYSEEPFPGARVDDLYVVCGQAQKSVVWGTPNMITKMFQHLRCRDDSWIEKHGVSRFERGDRVALDLLAPDATYLDLEFKMFLVQPGLSASRISTEQCDLLATTELYLKVISGIPLEVIGSA